MDKLRTYVPDGDGNMVPVEPIATPPQARVRMPLFRPLRRSPALEPGPLYAVPAVAPPAQESQEDIVSIPEDDKKFLFDTGEDDPFITGEGATDIIGMTDADKEYLFGTGEKPTKRTVYRISASRVRRNRGPTIPGIGREA